MNPNNSQRSNGNDYQNLTQKTIEDADHLIKEYHTEVERLFDCYDVDSFVTELNVDVIVDKLNAISLKFNVDSKHFKKFSEHIKKQYLCYSSSTIYECLIKYISFITEVKSLILNMRNKLDGKIINGLLRYCVSYKEFCTVDLEFVNNYEKLISKNKPDIIKQINDLIKAVMVIQTTTNTCHSLLIKVSETLSGVKCVRSSVNRLYYLITEWTDEERYFSDILIEEKNSCKENVNKLEQDLKSLTSKVQIAQLQLSTLKKKELLLMKRRIPLERWLKRVDNSKFLLDGNEQKKSKTMVTIAEDIGILRKKIKKLEYLKKITWRKSKIPLYKLSMDLAAAKTQMRELEMKKFKADDDIKAIERHQSRISYGRTQAEEKLNSIKNKLISVKSQIEYLKIENNDYEIKLKDKEDELILLKVKYKDLNLIYSKKTSPDTIRQLKNYGQLQIPKADNGHLLDVVCETIVSQVKDPQAWKNLYMNLPIHPLNLNRTASQRERDIDTLDRLGVHRDATAGEQMTVALNRWRGFYHRATVDELIVGLEAAHLYQLANDAKTALTKANAKRNKNKCNTDNGNNIDNIEQNNTTTTNNNNN